MGVNLANTNLNGNDYTTEYGGYCVKFINGCAGASVKGTIVAIDTTDDNTVVEAAVDSTNVIGVMYSDGVAVGGEVWVVVSGKAEVGFHDNIGVKGDYVRSPEAGDAAIAVAEQYTFTVTHAATVAGNLLVKIPSLAAVTVALAGTEDEDAVAAAIAAKTFTGWTVSALLHVVTFDQNVAATTDGIAGYTPAGTGVTITATRTAIGKPAITPTDGVAVADGTIPAAGEQVGVLLEDHTARRYADDFATALCVLKSS